MKDEEVILSGAGREAGERRVRIQENMWGPISEDQIGGREKEEPEKVVVGKDQRSDRKRDRNCLHTKITKVTSPEAHMVECLSTDLPSLCWAVCLSPQIKV